MKLLTKEREGHVIQIPSVEPFQDDTTRLLPHKNSDKIPSELIVDQVAQSETLLDDMGIESMDVCDLEKNCASGNAPVDEYDNQGLHQTSVSIDSKEKLNIIIEEELDELDELLSDAVQDLTLKTNPIPKNLLDDFQQQQLSSEDILTREKAEFAAVVKSSRKTLSQKQFYVTPRQLSVKQTKPLPKTSEVDDIQTV